MIPGLLAVALIAAAPQTQDSALRARLALESLDREAAIDSDGRSALVRAARDADLTSFLAHREYIADVLNRAPGGIRELRKEYDLLPPSGLRDCLRAFLAAPPNHIPTATPALVAMDARGAGSGCPAALLAETVGQMVPRRIWAPRRLEYLKRALDGGPDTWWHWRDYAGALAGASRFDEAIDVLTTAMGRFHHPIQTTRLQLRKASILLQRGDTSSGMALARAVALAVARDGRPGVLLLSLSASSEVVDTRNVEGSDLDPRLRMGAQLARQHGAWDHEWRFLYTLSGRLVGRGDASLALTDYERMIHIADSTGVERYQIMSYMRRGRALEHLGRLGEAEGDLLHAIAIGRGADEPYYLAESYHNLAHLHESAGHLQEAARAINLFIETIRPLSHSPLRMTAFLDAGEIRWKAGWHAAAGNAFDSMVAVIDLQQQSRYFAGEHLERTGNLGSAARYYAAAVADGEDIARNLGGLVRVFRALGELDSATAAAQRHDLEPLGELDTPLLPDVLAAQGDLKEAVRLSASWAMQRLRQHNVRGAAIAHLKWAELLIQDDRAAEAMPILTRVDSLAAIRNLTRERIEGVRMRGLAMFRAGQRAEGLVALQDAARLSRQYPASATLVATHLALGNALTANGRPLQALEAFDVAARETRAVTGSLDADFDRVRFRAQGMAPFDGALRALLHLPGSDDRTARLVEWSARRKAAALALAIQQADGRAPVLSPISLAAIQSRLAPDEALLDYVIVDSVVTAIVVTRPAASTQRVPVTADSLAGMIRELRRPFSVTYNGRIDLARAPFRLDLSRALHTALIAPLRGDLEGVRRLLVVPDGVLHYLPFAALVSSTDPDSPGDAYSTARYLVDDYESSYLPSAAFLPSPARTTASTTGPSARILALTHDAPGGEREVGAIAALWQGGGVQRLEGPAATETAVQRTAADYDVLHFAVHAIANDEDPLASYLRLAPGNGSDGQLHLSEIAGQSHSGQLVILSACETQMGRLYYGEGIMGLTRAFLTTGAAAVVATQWPVGEAAADLMTGFYRSLATGTKPTAALRSAQLRLRSDARTAHPFFWAAFGVYLGS